MDYRCLNNVAKSDNFRIDDLLDELGKAKFFLTLDLATGFWQHVHDGSQENTAFVTPFGPFKFRVMPFGLKNAQSVFQWLMQQVLSGVNPENGPSFVAAYIDDLLIFSFSLQQHLARSSTDLEKLDLRSTLASVSSLEEKWSTWDTL